RLLAWARCHGRLSLHHVLPPLGSGAGVDGVEVAVPRAGVDRPCHHDRIGGHGVARREEPRRRQRTSGRRRQRRDAVEAVAQVVAVRAPVDGADRGGTRGACACAPRRRQQRRCHEDSGYQARGDTGRRARHVSGRISVMSRRVLLASIATLAVVLAFAGVAAAVSDGNYRSEKQHCSGGADNSDRPKHVEKDCKNTILTFSDGKDREYGGVGLRQTADGENPDPTPGMTPASSSTDPTSGVRLYMGSDDNLDVGEHDSSEQVNNGPSDGGAIVLNVMPDSVAKWASALSGGDLGYLLTHPVPLVD